MNLSLCKRKACNGVINQSSFYLKYKTQLRPRKLLFLGDKLLFRSWRPGWCKHSDRERRGHRQSTPDQRSNGQRSGTILPYPSILDFWKIQFEKSTSTNWISSLFQTGFLLLSCVACKNQLIFARSGNSWSKEQRSKIRYNFALPICTWLLKNPVWKIKFDELDY